MVRKWASFTLGLALIVALGFAIAQVQPGKITSASNGFSAPCEPASSVLKSASETKAISTIHSTLLVGVGEEPVIFGQSPCVDPVPPIAPVPAPPAFPPLLRRPPPANS
jgi:hypothetical protein